MARVNEPCGAPENRPTHFKLEETMEAEANRPAVNTAEAKEPVVIETEARALAIEVNNVKKIYKLYDRLSDRMK